MRRIDSRELSEWMAYYSIEPFGEIRADWRQAMTSMILANANRGKGGRSFNIKDFMLINEKKRKRQQQTPEEMAAILNLLC